MAIRSFGKAAFVKIQDRKGQLQCYIAKNILSEQDFSIFKKLDIGDIIYVSGKLFRTKTNELTLEAESVRLTAKSIRPLPEKWHGLTDIETRYRQRHLDLISNPAVKEIFIRRSLIISRSGSSWTGTIFWKWKPHDAAESRRRRRPAVQNTSQRAGSGFVSADRPELYLKRLVTGGLKEFMKSTATSATKVSPRFTTRNLR